MTLGERITSLRKEKGLSQEALGERIGVSRQAVSKWEADRAIPDMDNCVAMSKVFEVSLPRLLDIEEQGEVPGQEQRQLELVRQVADGYEAARKRAARRWRWPVILVLCLLAVGAAWLWEWLGEMNRSIEYLSGELSGLRGEIVSGVGEQFEETLKAQDSLLSDLTYKVVDVDLLDGRITYELTATPKTAGEQAKVRFWAISKGEETGTQAAPGAGQTWSGRLECPLSDEIRLYMAIAENGQTRSELLAVESGREREFSLQLEAYCPQSLDGTELYYGGLPGSKKAAVSVMGFLYGAEEMQPQPGFETVWVGVFVNDNLVERHDLNVHANRSGLEESFSMASYFMLENLDMKYEDTLTVSVFAGDNYGRRVSRITQRYWVDAKNVLFEQPYHDLDDGSYGLEAW